jgi:hypothetical protein
VRGGSHQREFSYNYLDLHIGKGQSSGDVQMGFGRGRLGQVVKETLSEPMTTFALRRNGLPAHAGNDPLSEGKRLSTR